MSEEKKYSVIELSERLNVKRTTVNDWLNRYTMYIESSLQGKRRLYSESALAVLGKIAELRGKGLSSTEIDGELAKLYAVHPQPEMTEQVTETLPQLTAVQKNESAELLRQFQIILEKLDRLEQTEKALPPPPPPIPAPAKKGVGFPLLLLTFVFLAGLLAAVSLYARKEISTMQQESRRQTEEIRRQSSENAGLKRDVYLLDKSRSDFEQNVKRLEAAIAQEKADQQEQIKRLEASQQEQLKRLEASQQKRLSDLEELRRTEAELQKLKYEKEYQSLKQKLEEQLKNAEKLAAEKLRIAQEKSAAEKKLNELQKAVQEKTAPVQPPAPAPVTAPAAPSPASEPAADAK